MAMAFQNAEIMGWMGNRGGAFARRSCTWAAGVPLFLVAVAPIEVLAQTRPSVVLLCLLQRDRIGYISRVGKTGIRAISEGGSEQVAWDAANGPMLVRLLARKRGFLDSHCRFEKARHFSAGLALVCAKGKWEAAFAEPGDRHRTHGKAHDGPRQKTKWGMPERSWILAVHEMPGLRRTCPARRVRR